MSSFILDNIVEIPIKVKNNSTMIIVRGNYFNGHVLNTLAGKIKFLMNNYDNLSIKVLIRCRFISDMATITVMEYILYTLFKETDFRISISFRPDKKDYFCMYLFESILGKFINSNKSFILAKKNFVECFESEITQISTTHFRKVLNNSKKEEILSKTYSELNFFLKQKILDYSYKEDCLEAIMELCGNALEHTNSNCILSLECGEAYINKNKVNVLTVVISNLSNNLFFDKLKDMHQNKKRKFDVLDKAFLSHKRAIFDENISYNLNRFYMVSAFQNGVSTRENQCGSGGTGLFKTINNILGKTVDDLCYFLSGEEVLFLKENLIIPSQDSYIGFNDTHNYISDMPDTNVFSSSGMYFNGTLIHLRFALGELSEK